MACLVCDSIKSRHHYVERGVDPVDERKNRRGANHTWQKFPGKDVNYQSSPSKPLLERQRRSGTRRLFSSAMGEIEKQFKNLDVS